MERNIYFDKMRETSAVVIPLINKYYSELSSGYHTLSDSIDLFVKKRTNSGQCLLRPYLVRLAYEASGGNDWLKIAPACSALEIFNISTYQSNISFDGKNGVVTDVSKNNQFISSMISVDLAAKILMGLSKTSGSRTILRILERLYETNDEIYVGQYYNLNRLNLANLDLSMPIKEYLKIYIFRCEKLGGSLTSLCFEVGGLLAGTSNKLLNNSKNIGRIMGIAGQIVNDISDFVPNNTLGKEIKLYEDSFSDLKRGNVTYPIFYLMKFGTDSQREAILDFLNQNDSALASKEDITKMLYQSKSIKATKELVIRYYKMLKEEVQKIPKSESRDLLSLSFSSLLTNKYFAILRMQGY